SHVALLPRTEPAGTQPGTGVAEVRTNREPGRRQSYGPAASIGRIVPEPGPAGASPRTVPDHSQKPTVRRAGSSGSGPHGSPGRRTEVKPPAFGCGGEQRARPPRGARLVG